MDQEKSVDKEFRLHRGATWTGKWLKINSELIEHHFY
jgi:hypothetical protein